MLTRTRYQNGSFRVKKRKNGMRVWEFRYAEAGPDGKRRSRAVTIGTVQEYPTETSAQKSPTAQALVLRINSEHPLGPVTASTVVRVDRTLRKGGNARPLLNAGFVSIVY
jgi:integrase